MLKQINPGISGRPVIEAERGWSGARSSVQLPLGRGVRRISLPRRAVIEISEINEYDFLRVCDWGLDAAPVICRAGEGLAGARGRVTRYPR